MRLVGRRRVGGGGALVGLDGAVALVDRLEELAQRLGQAGRVLGQQAQLVDLLGARVHGAAPHDRRVAERLERGGARRGERAQAGQEGLEARRGGLQVAQHRGLGPGQRAELVGVRLELAEEGGQVAERGGQRVATGRGGLRGQPGLAHEAADVALARLERADHAVGVGDQRPDRARLAAEDAQRLARLAQAGRGAPDGVVEVVRAPGQACAELADDQAQAVAEGPPQDVVDQVEPDRRAGLADRDAPAVRYPARRGARLAVDEVLADERLRADLAAGVRAQVGQAGLGHLRVDDRERVRLALEVDVLGRAGAHSGDLEVAALGEAEGVVEHDLVGLGPVVAARGAEGERPRDAGGDHRRDCEEALHGPTALWLGSQSSCAASSADQTLVPSLAAASLAPGQRRNWPVLGLDP